MRQKIFISYRRQDSAASAIGIGQYLENEFGRKNVYIDIDLHAGTKFPAVIEKRLAECKVLLVLIGPEWVKAQDEHGHPRLQKSNDWVRLEIAYALKQNLTVIPVLINGAKLPDKEILPEDIQGLLDHQAASVSLTGFRHEMAGLVRDIRSIKSPRPWRLYGAAAAALTLSLVGGFFIYEIAPTRNLASSPRTATTATTVATTTPQNALWKSEPGQWVMYGSDKWLSAYFMSPSSVKSFGDGVLFTSRFPYANASGNPKQGAYQDDRTVLDCKKSDYGIAERTVYNTVGEILSHLKYGEPEALSDKQPIPAGSLLAGAQSILCDKEIRSILSSKPKFIGMHLSYLANAPDGDGVVSYGPIKPTSNPAYPFEVYFVVQKNGDHTFTDLFPGQNIRGLPASYHTFAQTAQISCAEKKVLAPLLEYYDGNDKLIYLMPATPVAPLDVKDGSILHMLRDVVCRASGLNVAGTYEGTNNASYDNKLQADQKISIAIQQKGSDLKVSFQTATGGQGEGVGKLTGNRVEAISLRSTTPDCPGAYQGSLTFAENSIGWSYKGQDCGGSMEGRGTAKKMPR